MTAWTYNSPAALHSSPAAIAVQDNVSPHDSPKRSNRPRPRPHAARHRRPVPLSATASPLRAHHDRCGGRGLLASCAAAAPSIDILVNNYGTAGPGRWDDAGTDAWLGMYQHNVLSAQRLIRALLPAMRTRKWGRIINLGTVGSTRPAARMPHYYASKGALATLR